MKLGTHVFNYPPLPHTSRHPSPRHPFSPTQTPTPLPHPTPSQVDRDFDRHITPMSQKLERVAAALDIPPPSTPSTSKISQDPDLAADEEAAATPAAAASPASPSSAALAHVERGEEASAPAPRQRRRKGTTAAAGAAASGVVEGKGAGGRKRVVRKTAAGENEKLKGVAGAVSAGKEEAMVDGIEGGKGGEEQGEGKSERKARKRVGKGTAVQEEAHVGEVPGSEGVARARRVSARSKPGA